MSISFYPLGIPFSSSLAISASFAVSSSIGGLPYTASFASYSIEASPGPQGPPYGIVNADYP